MGANFQDKTWLKQGLKIEEKSLQMCGRGSGKSGEIWVSLGHIEAIVPGGQRSSGEITGRWFLYDRTIPNPAYPGCRSR